MKSTIDSRTDTSVKLTISLDAKQLEEMRTHTIGKLRPKVKAAGFRPGKAPDAIVERELGANYVQSEVLEEAVTHSYSDAVREHDLPVIAQPDVKVVKFVPYSELEYTADVDVMPKVTLGDYKKIKKSKPAVTVTDKEVDEVVEDLRKRGAERKEVTRAAKNDDEVTIDFDGFRDGKAIEGTSAKSYSLLLGSGSFIPGFEEELVGLKAGDEKTFDITFPKDYAETSLAGQKVQFKVKVHKVSEADLPELNDEFAKSVSGMDTLAAMRDQIRDRVKHDKTEEVERKYEEEVLEEVIKTSKYTLPPKMVESQAKRLKADFEQNLTYRGLDLEKYFQISGTTQEELDKQMAPEADKRVALAMILTEVAKEEGLSVDDAELDAELTRLRAAYPDPQMQAELAGDHIREDVYNHLMATKTIAKIIEYVEKN